MAKQPNKRRRGMGERLPPFAPILFDELNSAAYQNLPGSAAKALPYFKRIHGIAKKRLGDNYNGIFDFTYTEAENCGFARATFNRVVTALNAKGFIDIVKQGGRRSCGMSNSQYKLSERWRDFGRSGFIKRPRYPHEPPA
jgi:hypothetical protein